MKLLKWLSPAIVALGLVACNESNSSFETKDVEGQFSIEIPDYMEKLNLENPDAIFQYGNELKEHYVMVIMETHEELKQYDLEMSIEEYADLSIEFLKSSINDPVVEEVGEGVTTVNGMEAVGYKINGVFPQNNLDIFYYAMFYRSEKAFYYVTTWTLAEREEKFIDNMEKIVHSIKEK